MSTQELVWNIFAMVWITVLVGTLICLEVRRK